VIRTSHGPRWIPWLLFAVTFLSYAYFHQGGGWNQNVRFAMVRAIVEEGNFWIDSYLVYVGAASEQGTRLVRVPVRNAEFAYGDRKYAFRWRDVDGRPIPLANTTNRGSEGSEQEVKYIEPEQSAVSGDVSFFRGHFHPAKAPGVSFLAVPAYSLIYAFERMTGIDPDDWWTLTINAWLTSLLTVGLISALGCVVFYRLALRLSDGHALESVLTTLALAFGTMFFPYGTVLYEHNIVAMALLASFYLLFRVKESHKSPDKPLSDSKARLYVYLAGLFAGYAAITNYTMVIVVVLLGCYLLLGVQLKGGWRWFGLGVLGPFLMICAYNVACFSTPFTTNYRYENPLFKSGSKAFLDVFIMPQWKVLAIVLFSPYRGLFISAPILLLGAYGLAKWLRSGKLRAEALLIISVLAFFLLFIMTFNGWDGGWAVGPRYLVPALPFLALPLVPAFSRFFKTACILAAVSIIINLLVTAVDPQAPVGNARYAQVEGRSQWRQSPLTDYVLPLFLEGRAEPLLRTQRDVVLSFYDYTMRAEGVLDTLRAQRLTQLRDQINADIDAGEQAPLLLVRGVDGKIGLAQSELPTIRGPVSANPMGVYEGWMYRVFPIHSAQTDRNSFNVGEFLFGRSRWSLSPFLIIAGTIVAVMVRMAIRAGN
jgi:hypothetical protein